MEHDNGDDDGMNQLEEKRRANRRPTTITHYTQLLESEPTRRQVALKPACFLITMLGLAVLLLKVGVWKLVLVEQNSYQSPFRMILKVTECCYVQSYKRTIANMSNLNSA
jgi:hypothetical protein